MAWSPGDPWPGTAGGAARDEWSGYIRVYVQAQIAAGTPFTMGPASSDRLNAGNVMSQAGALERVSGLGSALWVDLTPDLVQLDVSLGSSTAAGILSKAEAGTLTATLYDPDGKYDPTNPDTPFALGNRTRLTPGVPVRCWCEVVWDAADTSPPYNVNKYPLFTGTADRWSHDWTSDPAERMATLTATDPTKQFSRSDKPELPTPVGAGDAPFGRLQRIITNMGWTGALTFSGGTGTVTLQATTLAQSAWELCNRAVDDELGFVYFKPQDPAATTPGTMLFHTRAMWTGNPAPTITIGCGAGMHDIATEVVPLAFDRQLTNAVYASRTGGSQQTVKSASSIARFFEQSLQRSDLGLASDPQVATWAQALVNLYAFPHTTIEKITIRPDVDPAPWTAWGLVLGIALVSQTVRVVWDQADYTADVSVKIVGTTHSITPDAWEVEWRTVSTTVSSTAYVWTLGPDTQDSLDAGYVLG